MISPFDINGDWRKSGRPSQVDRAAQASPGQPIPARPRTEANFLDADQRIAHPRD